jgi:2-oxo-4-hydroxy-4-carboxy-5-ureidoimidazoline decarboxylase
MPLAQTTQSRAEALSNARTSLAQLNGLDQAAFVRLVGPVFEHSPWIAEAAWPRRPFTDLAKLHAALCEIVRAASADQKLALICAHPDLAGRAALAGSLTRESAAEQASAGLDCLSPADLQLLRQCNSAYRAKFGFPFVICARLNDKQMILSALARRLKNTRESELEAALDEIFKIAELRLRNLVGE